jgi:hypothetical protein
VPLLLRSLKDWLAGSQRVWEALGGGGVQQEDTAQRDAPAAVDAPR